MSKPKKYIGLGNYDNLDQSSIAELKKINKIFLPHLEKGK